MVSVNDLQNGATLNAILLIFDIISFGNQNDDYNNFLLLSGL